MTSINRLFVAAQLGVALAHVAARTSAREQNTQRVTISESTMDKISFSRIERDPKPYGKKARRQLRGGRHD
ncbi:hypothetical protein [uncultured Stenotrophomonas sp.]|uniref:hypothetical protein n=1 Tax=uncultured Stenotrophomonas sp. TaxID=165438 RepID=UPI0025F487A4|nr:hypothetical protein [uncultured Stenotrophomonas sp.]